MPPPKVASALIEIVPQAPAQSAIPVSVLERVTAAAFGQRRKMLRSSLGSLGAELWRSSLGQASILPNAPSG